MSKTIEQMRYISTGLVKIRKMIEANEISNAKLRTERDSLQQQLIGLFKKSEVQSIKTLGMSVSVKQRAKLVVVNEQAVIRALQLRGLTDYFGVQLNDLFKKSLAPKLASQGEKLSGTTLEHTDFISVVKGRKPDEAK